ncbi:hypothetical protein SAMN04488003_101375 [Loktanella fryxellensis]|uniref:Transcriptional activator HlyU n=1 Tax=Loktanella fryxellensis TaxID=245187 RepID=A0A1H7YYK5_9RHOB|nr:HlyU family transcriptional regulator [Loktanella fryxellensis]SEM51240.1 hypothetical protein SAMN04488003_101375 [Loktanella fryxellensis]
MSLWSRLLGGRDDADTGGNTTVEPVLHNGFRITPDPIREGSVHRIAAHIAKDIDGVSRSHHLIRADTMADRDEAMSASIAKARQMIDEQGDALFR